MGKEDILFRLDFDKSGCQKSIKSTNRIPLPCCHTSCSKLQKKLFLREIKVFKNDYFFS